MSVALPIEVSLEELRELEGRLEELRAEIDDLDFGDPARVPLAIEITRIKCKLDSL